MIFHATIKSDGGKSRQEKRSMLLTWKLKNYKAPLTTYFFFTSFILLASLCKKNKQNDIHKMFIVVLFIKVLLFSSFLTLAY